MSDRKKVLLSLLDEGQIFIYENHLFVKKNTIDNGDFPNTVRLEVIGYRFNENVPFRANSYSGIPELSDLVKVEPI